MLLYFIGAKNFHCLVSIPNRILVSTKMAKNTKLRDMPKIFMNVAIPYHLFKNKLGNLTKGGSSHMFIQSSWLFQCKNEPHNSQSSQGVLPQQVKLLALKNHGCQQYGNKGASFSDTSCKTPLGAVPCAGRWTNKCCGKVGKTPIKIEINYELMRINSSAVIEF